jgi:hypothetical protein
MGGSRRANGRKRLGKLLASRTLPLVLTAWCVGLEMGWAWMIFFHGFAIDSGIAGVTTAMMALAGSAWMVQYKARAEEQPFEMYVADAAAAMRDEAFVLLKLAEMPLRPEPATEARILADQVERLRRCLKVFQKGSPYTQIRSYGARMRIEQLEEEVSEQVGLLDREIAILGTYPTKNVVQVAKQKCRRATEGILENTQQVCEVLGYEALLPSESEISLRAAGGRSQVAARQRAALSDERDGPIAR